MKAYLFLYINSLTGFNRFNAPAQGHAKSTIGILAWVTFLKVLYQISIIFEWDHL